MDSKNVVLLFDSKDGDLAEEIKIQFRGTPNIELVSIGDPPPGVKREKFFAEKLEKANIVVPLISANFLYSAKYQALQKAADQEADFNCLPVLNRPCYYEDTPLLNTNNLMTFNENGATNHDQGIDAAALMIRNQITKELGKETQTVQFTDPEKANLQAQIERLQDTLTEKELDLKTKGQKNIELQRENDTLKAASKDLQESTTEAATLRAELANLEKTNARLRQLAAEGMDDQLVTRIKTLQKENENLSAQLEATQKQLKKAQEKPAKTPSNKGDFLRTLLKRGKDDPELGDPSIVLIHDANDTDKGYLKLITQQLTPILRSAGRKITPLELTGKESPERLQEIQKWLKKSQMVICGESGAFNANESAVKLDQYFKQQDSSPFGAIIPIQLSPMSLRLPFFGPLGALPIRNTKFTELIDGIGEEAAAKQVAGSIEKAIQKLPPKASDLPSFQ